MAPTLTRAIATMTARNLTLSLLFPKRLLSTITKPPSVPTLTLGRRAAIAPLSHAVNSISGPATRFTSIRCRVNRSGTYSPLNSGSNFSDRPPTEMAPLFPGCDYQHWLIVMDKPGGEGATKQQMIDCYIQTLAKVLGSEEEAKKKIYNVSCERYFGFGCEIDEETSNKLEGLPGVLFVLPDSYVDPEYKDYGGKLGGPMKNSLYGGFEYFPVHLGKAEEPNGQWLALNANGLISNVSLNCSSYIPLIIARLSAAELFVNGEIVQRSPERQRRVEPQPQRAQDRPRYNDRTRYVRRRENSQ
ncbi:hypothetical protein PanWU01x14_355210 [Parasponia andersonii]|uniref:MORF/ORRM1/DAG-like MORF domain-containing protein n=1 Tax=Parasponia andersonii TaxID=3476 RepID=A0A2P5A9B5_PARAD|nr:hypothetical protein PanWU01x14_355210 [Parasponia andersonii]